jgi:hypothetical protein
VVLVGIATLCGACTDAAERSEPVGTVKMRVQLPKGSPHPLNAWIIIETRRGEGGPWRYFDRLGGQGNGPGPLDFDETWDASIAAPDAECRALACADGYATTTLGPFHVDADKTTDLGDVVLEAGLELVGRVEDPAGRPVAEAWVFGGEPLNGFWCPGSKFTQTGADGAFRLANLAAHEQPVMVESMEFAPAVLRVTPREGAPPTVVRLGPGEVVRVTALDREGKAFVGAPVDFLPDGGSADLCILRARAKTDADGACALRVAAGTWRFVVLDPKVVGEVVAEVVAGKETSVRAVVTRDRR